jgi:Uma2 family endonuclease
MTPALQQPLQDIEKQIEIDEIEPQLVSFDEFVEWLPESSEKRYELYQGVIVEMPKAKGKHSDVGGFIHGELFLEIRRLQLPYFIPKECLIRSIDETSGYEPDVIVLDREAVAVEPRWTQGSIITMGTSIKLVVEVVSTNWQNDYARKLVDYEALGIQEYWVVDYAALGARRLIGNPKQPTFNLYSMVDGEYELQQFRGDDRIISPTFPDLNLTAAQAFAAGEAIAP